MAKKQHEIYKRQNMPEMQQLLVAQHYTYSNAKRWAVCLFLVLVVFPVCINITLFFELPEIAIGLLSFSSILLLCIGEIIRAHVQNQKRYAAMIQQKFDLFVFDMPLSSGLDENIIAVQQEKYVKKEWQRKHNWYQNYEGVNNSLAVFYCQKENMNWTGNISKKYCAFIISLISLLSVAYIVNIILHNESIIKILSILLAILPLLSYGFSSYKKISIDNKEMEGLTKIVQDIEASMDSISENDLLNKLIVLQFMIYRFRQSKYLVPDWFEQIFYKKMQSIESRKTKQRIKKYKDKARLNKE